MLHQVVQAGDVSLVAALLKQHRRNCKGESYQQQQRKILEAAWRKSEENRAQVRGLEWKTFSQMEDNQ